MPTPGPTGSIIDNSNFLLCPETYHRTKKMPGLETRVSSSVESVLPLHGERTRPTEVLNSCGRCRWRG